jgi:D-alanyl-D-alanine carboxypeptidase/D-alanyl-D-alanine-endopeptidase (penicillin-binding protein 4)
MVLNHAIKASSVFVALWALQWMLPWASPYAQHKAQQQAGFGFSYTSNAQLHQTLYSKNPAFYAYILGDVAGKKVDCHHAAQTYITPASCQKIITALLAFRILGPQYRYKTQLFVSKQGGRIHRARICFSGDPLLTSAQLKILLKPLEKAHIQGGIVLDGSGFQTPEYSQDWMIADQGSGYAGPVSSANIDHNGIEVSVRPNGDKTGVVVTNNVNCPMIKRVTISHKPTKIQWRCLKNSLEVWGNLNHAEQEKIHRISPHILSPYLLEKVRQVTKSLGISGPIEYVTQPNQKNKREQLVAEVYSKTLREFLPPAFKISDNLVFDALYLTLIHQADPAGGMIQWSQGDVCIKVLLKKHFNLDMTGALFVDGSGLSRYNRISPAQLWAVLRAGFGVPEFIHAFAYPGEQASTLFKRKTLPPDVRAKTGHLLGVTALSGYVLNGRRKKSGAKAFVFVANGFACAKEDVHHVMDGFLKAQLGTVPKTQTHRE